MRGEGDRARTGTLRHHRSLAGARRSAEIYRQSAEPRAPADRLDLAASESVTPAGNPGSVV